MEILKFTSYLKENKNYKIKYYAFDYDDNILFMPTVVHMERKENEGWYPEDVSTSKFSIIRNDKVNWRYPDNDPEKAFSDFSDNGPKGSGIFLEDTKKAISDKKFGPSWKDFIECLTNGSLFAIITARGHDSEIIKEVVEWIIDNMLSENKIYKMYNNLLKFSYLFDEEVTDDRLIKGKPSENKLVQRYLDNCDFVGISNSKIGGNSRYPEKLKESALLDFHNKINKFAKMRGFKAIIGFSDDDFKNTKHIEDLYSNLNKENFANIIGYVVKNTRDPKNIIKTTKYLESSPGLDSSVIKFTQFGNMTGHLYPSDLHGRQDDYANSFKRSVKYLAKTSKDVIKLKPKKRKRRIRKK